MGGTIERRLLQACHKVAEHEGMIWVCGGASNVGQIAHEVGVLLTNDGKGRMCCTSAIGAGSIAHAEIALKAKRNIVIDGCGNRCAFKILEKVGARIDYEMVVSNYIQKIPTLDISDKEVKEIARKIVEEAKL